MAERTVSPSQARIVQFILVLIIAGAGALVYFWRDAQIRVRVAEAERDRARDKARALEAKIVVPPARVPAPARGTKPTPVVTLGRKVAEPAPMPKHKKKKSHKKKSRISRTYNPRTKSHERKQPHGVLPAASVAAPRAVFDRKETTIGPYAPRAAPLRSFIVDPHRSAHEIESE